jgi:hypothetical protein
VSSRVVVERWRVGRQAPLAVAFLLLAPVFALLAVAGASLPGGWAVAGMTGLCAALAALCLGLAINLLRGGLLVGPDGVTGQGMVLRRTLRCEEVVRFEAGVEELAPNRRAAVVWARLRDGRLVTLPGSRVEGWTWNLERHRRIAAGTAAALNERLRRAITLASPP